MAGPSPKASWLVLIAAAIVALHPTAYWYTLRWSLAQWMPLSYGSTWQTQAWEFWQNSNRNHNNDTSSQLSLATVDVQEHSHDLVKYLESTYGKDWRRRPLLLQNLWTSEELASSSRKLSLSHLLQEELTVPYFKDSRFGALSPDGQGRVMDIVSNMTTWHAPHKIASQLVLQSYPEWIAEVAPPSIVKDLFGDYFRPSSIRGSGRFQYLPQVTTVPLFVAWNSNNATVDVIHTALHCEPIANLAVQLSGVKQWTLVEPQYWRYIKPASAPDGRAFFKADAAAHPTNVPTYVALTKAGDAMWVPTWTWHRVDYVPSDDISIGASLFHFRAADFVRNNPLFAWLIVPSLVLELIAYNTQ